MISKGNRTVGCKYENIPNSNKRRVRYDKDAVRMLGVIPDELAAQKYLATKLGME